MQCAELAGANPQFELNNQRGASVFRQRMQHAICINDCSLPMSGDIPPRANDSFSPEHALFSNFKQLVEVCTYATSDSYPLPHQWRLLSLNFLKYFTEEKNALIPTVIIINPDPKHISIIKF